MADEQHSTADAVAVLRDLETAERAKRVLLQRGVHEGYLRVDDPVDDVASREAEMRGELNNALVAPQLGVAWPKEGLKTLTVLFPALTVVITLAMLPVAWIFAEEWSVGGKVLLALVVGLTAGGTIAMVMGAAGARGPEEPLATETGVTLRVHGATDEVVETLRSFDPIRLDIVLPSGTPTGTTVTEDDDHPVHAVGERLANEPGGDWSGRDRRD